MMSTQLLKQERQYSRGKKGYQLDRRSEFECDRDKVLYSSALRRLKGVTQVTTPGYRQIFHDRLAHSLKVAQVARRIAERIARTSNFEDILSLIGGVEPDVAEAAALAHDLGHPPFGHIAEEVLDKKVRECGESGGYEGNAQSFRIVVSLENGSEGLNLTRQTLRGILKYPWLRTADQHSASTTVSVDRWKKFGAYPEEAETFRMVTGCESLAQKSIEAEIMDWADDVTFALHDLMDFYRVGLIPLDLLRSSDYWSRFVDEQEASGNLTKPPNSKAEKLMDEIRSTFPTMPFQFSTTAELEMKALQTAILNKAIPAISPRLAVPGNPTEKLVDINPGVKYVIQALKRLTWTYVINRQSLACPQAGQRLIVENLFDAFLGEKSHSFPLRYKTLLKKYSKPRVVADYLSSMTDGEAAEMHGLITGNHIGSALSPVVSD